MPVLRYHNGTAWTEVSAVGTQGIPGPPGDTGPMGPVGGPAVFGDLGDVDTAGATTNGTLMLSGGVWSPGPAVPANHGDFTGLDDDDHPQYYNEARGDARYLQTMKALWTPGPDWETYANTDGSLGYGELLVTRVGDFVVLEGMLESNKSITLAAASGGSLIGTVPVGFRPATQTLCIMTTVSHGGDEYVRVDVTAAGDVMWYNALGTAVTVSAGFWVAPCFSYRAAP